MVGRLSLGGAVLMGLSLAVPSQQWALQSLGTLAPCYYGGMAYDANRGVMVRFGGRNSTGAYVNGTWERIGTGAWLLRSQPAPTPRIQGALVYDSVRSRIVCHGGLNYSFGPNPWLLDTWEWDGNAWQLMSGSGPAMAGPMAFDSARGRTVAFDNAGRTWEWDGTTWLIVGTTGPSARTNHAMAYDSVRGECVLFGGVTYVDNGSLPPTVTYWNDTWTWNGNAWTYRGVGPSARLDAAMAFDVHGGRAVLFGGGFSVLSDTWAWNGTTWTQLPTSGPSPRFGSGMAYDSDRGRIVLFGGLWNPGQPPYSGTLGDTWELPTGYAGTFSTTATYGVGCGAPLLTIAPQPGSRPTIGFTQTSNIAGIPAVVGGFAAVAWGFSNQVWGSVPLPASLSSLGLTGCSLLTSVDGELGSSTTPTSATTARHTFFVPADPALVQVRVFLQAWTLSPGANPAEIILSNGLELRIGDG